MKNKFILAALALGAFVFGINNAQAQTASTAVNLILSDVISIDAGSIATGGQVDFNFTHVNHYHDGLTAIVPNSLIVTSTKNFNIHVKAEGESFTDGTNNIPVNVLIIKAATTGSMGGTPRPITLSTDDQLLIGNAPLGSALTLDLDYTIPAAKSSSPDILGKPAGTYTAQVTYTATAL